jgi:hypothetical protein
VRFWANCCTPLVLLVAASSNCSLIVDSDRQQCSTSAECTETGGNSALACIDGICLEAEPDAGPSTAADWSCLGSVAEPTNSPITFRILVTDFVRRTPIEEVQAKLCGRLDVDCSTPVEGAISELEAGILAVTTRANFPGYIQVESPGKLPTLAMLNPYINVNADGPRDVEVPLATANVIRAISSVSGVPADLDSGVVSGAVRDCQLELAAGARMNFEGMSANSVQFVYEVNGLLAVGSETTSTGLFGAVNLPPGFGKLTATTANETRIGGIGFLLRPGHVTVLNLVPSP